MLEPTIINVHSHSDRRGVLRYANEFTFPNVKRFYHIVLPEKGIIRAFHGHMKEEKYVYVIKGSVKIILAPLSDKTTPSKNVELIEYILNSQNPSILHIPSKFANGIMSLEDNSEIIFYSTLLLEDSLRDDYRFDEKYWGEDIWIQ